MLKVTKTQLDGVLLIEPATLFEDFRGQYVELYNHRLFQEAGITYPFVQDDMSVSTRHVLRGVHGDATTAKLVTCLLGRIYLVVINWDESSSQYGQWQSFTLSESNRHQVLVPPKFGNGHLVLSDRAIFHYKQTTEYHRESQFSLTWNDPKLGLWWPISDPIVSQRDQS